MRAHPPILTGPFQFYGCSASSWDVNEYAFIFMAYHNRGMLAILSYPNLSKSPPYRLLTMFMD